MDSTQSMKLRNSDDASDSADIIVIGCGIAGMSAALEIQRFLPGKSIMILEARDRIGGRAWTLLNEATTYNSNEEPYIVDLGATWIHGTEEIHPMIQLVEKYNKSNPNNICELRDAHIHDFATYKDDFSGKRMSSRSQWKAYHVFENFLEEAQDHAKSHFEETKVQLSVRDAIEDVAKEWKSKEGKSFQDDPLMQFFLKNYIDFDYGGASDRMAASWYADDVEYEGLDVFPSTGYKPILDQIVEDAKLDIRFDSIVTKLSYPESLNGAQVETESGKIYSASRVICTLPLGLLQRGDMVTFDPPLPETKQKTLKNIGCGIVNKVAIVFDECFWPKEPKGFGVSSLDSIVTYFVNRYPFTNLPILEAYIAGRDAETMEDQSDDEVLDSILDVILSSFAATGDKNNQLSKEEARKKIQKWYISRWGKDPYSRGSYAYTSTDMELEDYFNLLDPERDILYFAGEHTSRKFVGTMQGAYLTGRHAGRQVIESFGGKWEYAQ